MEERPHLGKGEKPSEKEVPKEAPAVSPEVKTSESRFTPEEEKRTEAGDIQVKEKVTSPPAEETSEKSEGSMSVEKSPEDAGT